MARKIVRVMSVLNIILSIVLYFAINNLFSNDIYVSTLLEETSFVSTLLRMTLYVIPGIILIAGLYGIVFSARNILTFIGIFDVLASACILLFLQGKTIMMLYLGIISIAIAIIYLISALLIKRVEQ